MIINGQALALKKEEKLKLEVDKLSDKGIKLKLAVIVFSDDQAGLLYSRLKQDACKRVGIGFEKYVVDFKEDLGELINRLNQDELVTGIMIQHPGIKWGKRQGMSRKEFKAWWKDLVEKIDKKKDVDGLRKNSNFELATIKAVMELINKNISSRDGMLIVVGAKGFVGKRLVSRLKKEGYMVKGLDMGDDLDKECKKAYVLISATGKNNLIKARMVKKGAVVIDLGWPKGDVEFEKVSQKASLITPVPGGVGPLTVVSLLENLVSVGYTIN